MRYLIAVDVDCCDVYAGFDTGLYADGRLIWHGYSDDLEPIVAAIVGAGNVDVITIGRRNHHVWPEVQEAADWVAKRP